MKELAEKEGTVDKQTQENKQTEEGKGGDASDDDDIDDDEYDEEEQEEVWNMKCFTQQFLITIFCTQYFNE